MGTGIKTLPDLTKNEALNIKESKDLDKDTLFELSFKNRKLMISYRKDSTHKNKYKKERNAIKLKNKLFNSQNILQDWTLNFGGVVTRFRFKLKSLENQE